MKKKNIKQAEAEVRQEERKKLTVTQQIAKLNKRLGNDKGAIKERRRLAK